VARQDAYGAPGNLTARDLQGQKNTSLNRSLVQL
jgi:hypothetical protein